MRFVFAIIVFVAATFSHAQHAALVCVDSNNVIHPANGAASITQLSAAAAQALATAEAAAAAESVSAVISNRLTAIETTIASQNAHAIFRGYVLSFGSALAPVTNCAVQIIKFATRRVSTNDYADVYTWFEVAPTNAPTVDYRAKLTTGSWAYLAAVSNTWPDTVAVDAGTNGIVQAYLTTVSLPSVMSNAFFRCNGAVTFVSGAESVLPVSGGLAVNGLIGITTNIVSGSVTNRFVGGILVP